MQVSHVSDHVTHAVVGGLDVINFGVSDDAELMNVLSKALYTDQQLAVVRETLCNAWDAHVEAGITDKPIHVTLTEEELIIRDFGTGIPYELIGPIYGTYGGSTKKHDGKQTGGFGLGCKSPFAYTDHFEVTSWSVKDGKMTIYNMSKSNAEVGGKPGIIPIASIPTTEQGLQVRMKLKEKHHRVRFDMLIKRILRNGEMNAIFNGANAEVIPFSECARNFFITSEPMIETDQQILIRYGHVIYPLEISNEFRNEYNEITEILDRIPTASGYRHRKEYRIVFQAPSSKISITPSREALSMQEHTIAAVTKLLKEFVAEAKAVLEKGCFAIMKSSIKETWLNNSPKVLFETEGRIPNLPADRGAEKQITDYPQLIERYASYSYPSFANFEKTDRLARIDALIEANFGDKKLLESYRALVQGNYDGECKYGIDWFKENILNQLIAAVAADDALHIDKLFIYAKENDSSWGNNVKLLKTKEFKDRGINKYLPWCRKILILAHNRLDFAERASKFPIMKHWLGKVENSFLYTVARSPNKVKTAREFFEKQGFTIIDLTKAHPWEPQDIAEPIQKDYIVKPRRSGIPTLKTCLDEHGNVNMRLPASEEKTLISDPEFVMKYNPKSEAAAFNNHTHKVTKFIVDKWGDKGGFVVNANQEERYFKQGAKGYEEFVLNKILEEIKTNPRIIESIPFQWNRVPAIMKTRWGCLEYTKEHHILRAVYSDEDLMEYFGLVQTMTEEDKNYIDLLTEIKNANSYSNLDSYKQINEFLLELTPNPLVEELFNKILKSNLVYLFEPSLLENYMTKEANSNTKQRELVRDMLLQAIEG